MSSHLLGHSFLLQNVYVQSTGTTAGILETKGPLGEFFDQYYLDHYHRNDSYEIAEIEMLRDAIQHCLKKVKKRKEDIDLYIGGDLNNQLTASYYHASHLNVPFLGVYSACATMGEAVILSSLLINQKVVDHVVACTVSHNATAERQFRYPIEYAIQRKNTSTFTATGGCAICLGREKSDIQVTAITLGKVVDFDQKDANDMGRAMAPAAFDTYMQHMKDLHRDGTYYDLILTGDLSHYGHKIMERLLKDHHQKYHKYEDCGCLLYRDDQHVDQGGSGPVCSALVTFGYVYQLMKKHRYRRVLVLTTGALLNPVMTNQKLSIPCVCHGFVLEGQQ